jgi:hypothetical protein
LELKVSPEYGVEDVEVKELELKVSPDYGV